MVVRSRFLLLGLLATTIAAAMVSGCNSTSSDTEATKASTPITGARSEAPPEARAAQAQAEAQMKSRASAQGQAYTKGMQSGQKSP